MTPSLRLRGLLDLAQDEDMLSPAARVHHAHSLAPARVALPPMPIGRQFLERWPIREEPGNISWRATDYICVAPATFVLRDVVVHGSSGILQVGDTVIAESLAARDAQRHGFAITPDGVALRPRPRRRLKGPHISLLAGNTGNYFHALMDGVFRLSALRDDHWQAASGLLHPGNAVAQRAMLDLLGLRSGLARLEVDGDEALEIDALIFPWTVYGLSSFHPCVSAFFDRISARVSGDGDFPRRFYVDRSGSPHRGLVNEAEVIAALAPLGFVSVRPERLSVADQVRLFRGASAIVAPHGAGLTNLGFCRPGCPVVELHMENYVHWAFRHLSALRELTYDCVVGREFTRSGHLHTARWHVSATHVAGATERVLGL